VPDDSLTAQASSGDGRILPRHTPGSTIAPADQSAARRSGDAQDGCDVEERPTPQGLTGLHSRACSSSSASPAARRRGRRAARAAGTFGRHRQRWHTGIPHYARVGIRGVYPGIDQVFHATQGELEYDLLVAPGADPSLVRIAFDGVDAMR
jgi:hypothetical protein